LTDRTLPLRQLTREAFAPFGEILEATGEGGFLINQGTTTRYHDLAEIEAVGPGARVIISLFRGAGFTWPVEIMMMERHPLGSQAFMPLHGRPWLAVVAPDRGGNPGEPLAFLVEPDKNGLRGVNYARNVWHHPLLSLGETADFLVIDRGGAGDNLEERNYPVRYRIDSPEPT
jgi:ureidoglycolate lyase